ncbi:MAG: thioredoxin domain-containing protein [Bacteroidetes bacterium]|nr:MAG: thioredoxin domain-containing protein [Bacteroidota bacterium]
MNQLIHENSPYLLQHAHNPVDWYAWNPESLALAKSLDKPILVSIGYSACHWCHVMERESFENAAIAKFMNENLVCIKIDREERPDVDQIYMDAVAAMGVRGGWPLNVFLTPDGKPFYGGTYFPPQNWANLVKEIGRAFSEHRQQIEDSAEAFTKEIGTSEIAKYGLTSQKHLQFSMEDLEISYQSLRKHFDKIEGGMGQAPKFPMPSIYLFLLRYYQITNNSEALDQVKLTLDKMANGGIYDQIGGGFSRYSVDNEWFAPHFEKMLYDNGQLLTLYSEAFCVTKNPLYKQIVFESIAFAKRELRSPENAFYAALDADSEGEEGKFYVWKEEELNALPIPDLNLFKKYYNIFAGGNWEHGQNILHVSDPDFAKNNHLTAKEFSEKLFRWKEILLFERSKKVRPSLDDKILTSWNALIIKGLADAYAVFGEKDFLDLAIQTTDFVNTKMSEGAKLFRNYKNQKASLNAYLEDYALFIQALLALFQVSHQEKYAYKAKELTDYVLENFADSAENMFFFTDKNSEKLISRKKEIFDNVIPASNSVMANNLYFLGILFENQNYLQIAEQMLATVLPLVKKEVRHLSNWASLLSYFVKPTAEIVIVGTDYQAFSKEIQQKYFPNKIIVASNALQSDLPLLQNRLSAENTIFVCQNKVCKLPVRTVGEAWELMH